MDIYLDNTRLTESGESLASALSIAKGKADSASRVIVEILADGRPVLPQQLDDDSFMSGRFGEVRLTSAEPRAFVEVTMRDASDALQGVRDDQREAARCIESGDMDSAFSALHRALGVWQAARQSLDQGAALLGIDLTTLPLESPDELPRAIARLAEVLEEVRRSVQSQDWAGLSDALLYDLDELIDVWRGLLELVAQRVSSGAGA